jgi:hypothetical protein
MNGGSSSRGLKSKGGDSFTSFPKPVVIEEARHTEMSIKRDK